MERKSEGVGAWKRVCVSVRGWPCTVYEDNDERDGGNNRVLTMIGRWRRRICSLTNHIAYIHVTHSHSHSLGHSLTLTHYVTLS